MYIITHRKIFFILTIIVVLISGFFIGTRGLPLGIDFTGGALVEVAYTEAMPAETVFQVEIEKIISGDYSLRQSDEGYILRMRDLHDGEHEIILRALSGDGAYPLVEKRFNSIGPVIGSELRSKALTAIVIVLLVTIIFIAFAFRGVSGVANGGVSSWRYGFVAIIALLHDLLIPAGAFALYASIVGAHVDTLFVMALLAILGYSVNDTIVVFDRVRENIARNKEEHVREAFEETVGKSLSQTYARSINTSLTTLFVLMALFILGGESTRAFTFVLMMGVIAGAYSSLCFAAPLLVAMQKKGR